MIEIQREGSTMEICINRPAAKNALTLEMYNTMTAALAQAEDDVATRAVLICGLPEVFTSGNDLKDFMQDPPTGLESPVYKFLEALVSFSKPLIAAVDGWAVGIGTTMLMHCDLVFATKRAKLKMPFVDLALVPEAGASLILPRMMGHQKAAELLFLSKVIDGEEAERLGLVNQVVSPEELLTEARACTEKLGRLAPESLRLTKMLLKRAQNEVATLEGVMKQEGELFIERLASADMAEAVSAFFEKRQPKFS